MSLVTLVEISHFVLPIDSESPVYAQILHVVSLVIEGGLVVNLIEGFVHQGQSIGAKFHVQHVL